MACSLAVEEAAIKVCLTRERRGLYTTFELIIVQHYRALDSSNTLCEPSLKHSTLSLSPSQRTPVSVP